MANIRVKCPTCQTDLEIDAEFEGQEVECGNCLQVFVAKSASSSSSGSRKTSGSSRGRRSDDDAEEERPKKKKKKRRRDDDDYDHDRYDEYDDDYYDRPRSGGGSGLAITSMILGIFSILLACCCGLFSLPISIAALITGGLGMKNEEGRGMAITGVVLGVISIIIAVINVIIGIGMNMNDPNGRFR
jgi:predicted Zn finger-like uncharacterized protein